MSSDRIEKKIVLKAPLARAWRALTNAEEFGSWFRVKLASDFTEGARVVGQITHAGYEHVKMEVLVERIDPMRLFSFRWHPYAIDAKRDYSSEPMTLVEFRLEASGEGTLLTIVESGFDAIPAERRDEAFRMNEGGWEAQTLNIERHVAA